MSNNRYFFLFLCLLLSLVSAGQQKSMLFTSTPPVFRSTVFFPVQSGSGQQAGLQPFVYQPSIPREAVFCRMESKVYQRYNFMFKIHAGEGDALPWTLKQ